MAAGWFNKVMHVLLTVCGEQNIENQFDSIVQNKVVYEKVSATLQQQLPSFFCCFLRHIFTLFSRHFVFVM